MCDACECRVYTKSRVEEATLAVLAGVTVMVPVAFTVPQPPVKGMV